MTTGKILVGTASWTDPGFVKFWYPDGIGSADRLKWYAQHFAMVEVNSTFYSVPQPATARRWCESTPENFVFDIKLHQLLSRHATQARLLPPEMQRKHGLPANARASLTADAETEMVGAFAPSLEVLRSAGKLGVLLLQLSPAFSPRKHSLDELAHLLQLISDYRVAVEFRNRNWVEGEQLGRTLEFLRSRGVSFANVDAPACDHFTVMPAALDAITSKQVAYLRLHGRNADAYIRGKTVAARFNYDYSDNEIEEVATRSQNLAREVKEVHVVFNNNARDYAPHAALRLRKALGQIIAQPSRTPELF